MAENANGGSGGGGGGDDDDRQGQGQTKPKPLRLVALTWNMSGQDNARTLVGWRQDQTLHEAWSDLALLMTSRHGMQADIIVVALQEVYAAGSNAFGSYFGSLLRAHWDLPEKQLGHHASRTGTYMGYLSSRAASFDQELHVFWNRYLWPDAAVDAEAQVCFGGALPMLPASCFKATLGVRFWARGKEQSEAPIFLLASHLPMIDTGMRGDVARTAAWQQSVNQVLRERLYPQVYWQSMPRYIQDPGPKQLAEDQQEATRRFAHTTVWMGDLNFRVDPDLGDRLSWLRSGQGTEELLNTDPSLLLLGAPFRFEDGWREYGQRQAQTLFETWRPPYAPTCKMRTLADFMMLRQDGLEEVEERAEVLTKARLNGDFIAYDDQNGRREPSWCDRIFYQSVRPGRYAYNVLPSRARKWAAGCLYSDHDAVVAELVVDVY